MSVYRHGRSWWYSFSFRGVRYRESTDAATREEALQLEAARRAELLAAVQGSLQATRRSPRFLDFAWGEFRQWCASEHKDRPSTYARYMRSVKVLAAYFGNRTLTAINAGLVEHYKIHRSTQPRKNARDGRLVTPAAVNRDLAALRILFNFAARLGQASVNPVVGVKFFPENNKCMRVISSAEEELYLREASPQLRDVAMLMLETGMRPGEIFHLRCDDFDPSLRAVHVRSGKTANASRFIPLTNRAFDVLSRRAQVSRDVWLFPCPHNPRMPVASVRKAHDAALRRSKIQPPFRLYDLRHTALTRMAMAGIDLPTLKELAGHSQIQMTMRYVHPTPEHKRRAIAKFEAASREGPLAGNAA